MPFRTLVVEYINKWDFNFFSNALPASRSIIHKRVDSENIGFPHHSIDLDTLVEQEEYAWHVQPLPGLFSVL